MKRRMTLQPKHKKHLKSWKVGSGGGRNKCVPVAAWCCTMLMIVLWQAGKFAVLIHMYVCLSGRCSWCSLAASRQGGYDKSQKLQQQTANNHCEWIWQTNSIESMFTTTEKQHTKNRKNKSSNCGRHKWEWRVRACYIVYRAVMWIIWN